MIKLSNVSLRYKEGILALDNISVDIKAGELVFLIGPSGAGKSSFIKTLLKEVSVTSGRVEIDGQDITNLHKRKVPKLRRKVGVVFQDFRLLPKKTVYENVAYAMEVVSSPKRLIKKNVPIVLEAVGLLEKAHHFPNQLSGGEQQRVSIARSMVNNPSILIADEPTGNLDPMTSSEIMRLLQSFNRRGTTIIIATHDRELVNRARKRVLEFDRGRIARDEMEGMYTRGF